MFQNIILVANYLEIKPPSLWNAPCIYHELKQTKTKQETCFINLSLILTK